MDTKAYIERHFVTLVVFLGIFVMSIAAIFSPAKIVTKTAGWSADDEPTISVEAPAATTNSGMALRTETWKAYPNYNIALGIIGFIAASGAIYSFSSLALAKREVREDETVTNPD